MEVLYQGLQQGCSPCSAERWYLWQVDVLPAAHHSSALPSVSDSERSQSGGGSLRGCHVPGCPWAQLGCMSENSHVSLVQLPAFLHSSGVVDLEQRMAGSDRFMCNLYTAICMLLTC